jgi:hypothetical protein
MFVYIRKCNNTNDTTSRLDANKKKNTLGKLQPA